MTYENIENGCVDGDTTLQEWLESDVQKASIAWFDAQLAAESEKFQKAYQMALNADSYWVRARIYTNNGASLVVEFVPTAIEQMAQRSVSEERVKDGVIVAVKCFEPDTENPELEELWSNHLSTYFGPGDKGFEPMTGWPCVDIGILLNVLLTAGGIDLATTRRRDAEWRAQIAESIRSMAELNGLEPNDDSSDEMDDSEDTYGRAGYMYYLQALIDEFSDKFPDVALVVSACKSTEPLDESEQNDMTAQEDEGNRFTLDVPDLIIKAGRVTGSLMLNMLVAELLRKDEEYGAPIMRETIEMALAQENSHE